MIQFIIGAPLKANYKRVYIAAGVISIFLYAAGIATGYFLQGDIFGVVEGEIGKIESDISVVEQELPLLSLRGEGSCRILSTLSSDVNYRLNRILEKIVELERQGANRDVYNKLLNDYTSLAVRGWILDKDIQQSCSSDSVIALYFYSVPCDDCVEQGEIFEEIEAKYGERFSVFVLNKDIDQPAINILARSFNITETPAIILDSRTFQGLMSRDALDTYVCKKLKEC